MKDRFLRLDLDYINNMLGYETIDAHDDDLLVGKRNTGNLLKVQGTFSRIVFGNSRLSKSILK